jgi:hypothetical protein
MGTDLGACVRSVCTIVDSLGNLHSRYTFEGYSNIPLVTMNVSSLACNLPIRDRGDILRQSSIVFAVLGVVCIALRFGSRPCKVGKWSDTLDDWVMVANAVCIIPIRLKQIMHPLIPMWRLSFS